MSKPVEITDANFEELVLNSDKPVLVDFWATWCGPCVRVMPELIGLHKKYAAKGLVIIGHTDKSSKNVSGFIKNHKIPFIITVGSSVFKTYGVKGIPHAFLLDTNGVVLWRGHSGSIKTKNIEEAL